MEADSKSIDLFTTRVRQMILQYNELREQNASLRSAMERQAAQVEQLQAQLAEARSDYESLKLARMVTITDGDMEAAQKRIARLIRSVDKCITLLSEK